MAISEPVEKTCGMAIGRGVGSGMLDEINVREDENANAACRAAHVEVGHALQQLGGRGRRQGDHVSFGCVEFGDVAVTAVTWRDVG